MCKRWLYGGIQDLREREVAELLLDGLDWFIVRVKGDRIVAWHMAMVWLFKKCLSTKPTSKATHCLKQEDMQS